MRSFHCRYARPGRGRVSEGRMPWRRSRNRAKIGDREQNPVNFVAAVPNIKVVHAKISTVAGIDPGRNPVSGRFRGPTPDKRWKFCVQQGKKPGGRHKIFVMTGAAGSKWQGSRMFQGRAGIRIRGAAGPASGSGVRLGRDRGSGQKKRDSGQDPVNFVAAVPNIAAVHAKISTIAGTDTV
jgi:hypothetical protein